MTEELDDDTFQWLSSLTDNLTEAKAKKLVGTAYGLKENEDKRLAESIVQVLTSANEKLFEKMKESAQGSGGPWFCADRNGVEMMLWHQH